MLRWKIQKSIERRGVDFKELADLESRNLLYFSDDAVLTVCRENIAQTKEQLKKEERQLSEIRSKADKLDGSIQYAIENIQNGYGSYEEVDASESEIIASLDSGQTLLARLEAEAKACDEEYRTYEKRQRYMTDLYKDVKRIVTTHEISLEDATPMLEDKETLREMFESQLMNFDRTCKQLDRAKMSCSNLRAIRHRRLMRCMRMSLRERSGTMCGFQRIMQRQRHWWTIWSLWLDMCVWNVTVWRRV